MSQPWVDNTLRAYEISCVNWTVASQLDGVLKGFVNANAGSDVAQRFQVITTIEDVLNAHSTNSPFPTFSREALTERIMIAAAGLDCPVLNTDDETRNIDEFRLRSFLIRLSPYYLIHLMASANIIQNTTETIDSIDNFFGMPSAICQQTISRDGSKLQAPKVLASTCSQKDSTEFHAELNLINTKMEIPSETVKTQTDTEQVQIFSVATSPMGNKVYVAEEQSTNSTTCQTDGFISYCTTVQSAITEEEMELELEENIRSLDSLSNNSDTDDTYADCLTSNITSPVGLESDGKHEHYMKCEISRDGMATLPVLESRIWSEKSEQNNGNGLQNDQTDFANDMPMLSPSASEPSEQIAYSEFSSVLNNSPDLTSLFEQDRALRKCWNDVLKAVHKTSEGSKIPINEIYTFISNKCEKRNDESPMNFVAVAEPTSTLSRADLLQPFVSDAGRVNKVIHPEASNAFPENNDNDDDDEDYIYDDDDDDDDDDDYN